MSNEQNTDQQQFWQMVMETFKSSQLSIRQFCKQEGLSEPSFYSWRKKLAKDNEPLKNEQKDTSSSAFIEVAMPRNESVALELVLSSGNTLRINSCTDSQTLTMVLSALCKAELC